MLVIKRPQAIYYASIYKVPKIIYRRLDIKKKPKQNRDWIAKATRKKVVGRAINKHIYSQTIVKVFKKY